MSRFHQLEHFPTRSNSRNVRLSNFTTLAGRKQCLLLGLPVARVLLAPVVEDASRRQPVGVLSVGRWFSTSQLIVQCIGSTVRMRQSQAAQITDKNRFV